MKTFRMIGMALVAIVLSFSVSSCSDDDDDNFIPVDYSQDLVGTWTCLDAGYAEALVISADGSVLSTGLDGDDYWEDLKGTVKVKNNKMELLFGEEDDFVGRFEMIPGEAFVIIEEGTGDRLTYRYCKQDLSKEILGQWVMNDNITDTGEYMVINTYYEDGKAVYTGFGSYASNYMVNDTTSYKVIGDLFIYAIPQEHTTDAPKHIVQRLTYAPNGTAYGDIMVHSGFLSVGDQIMEVSPTYLRVKQTLNLANQKYDYIKTYVTNVKGLDKDIPFMGYTFNFAKMTSAGFDKFLKTILFAVEFPDANTIKYSCVVEGTPMSMECPIEVDGNKMTVKMSERYAAYRDIDFYTYQDKDDSQMHMYMPTYTFENFFSNIQVGVMAERGELDLNDAAAVEAVHKSIADAVETINVSFVMGKSK